MSSSSSSSSSSTAGNHSDLFTHPIELPSLIDPNNESPYFLAKLALEGYRERLIQVFNFIDDAASARRIINIDEIDNIIMSLVDYLGAGEAVFVQARTLAQSHGKRYQDYQRGQAEVAGLAAEVRKRATALQSERVKLCELLHEAKQIQTSFANARGTSVEGESAISTTGLVVDPVQIAELSLRFAKGGGNFPFPPPPPGWHPGLPTLDSAPEQQQPVVPPPPPPSAAITTTATTPAAEVEKAPVHIPIPTPAGAATATTATTTATPTPTPTPPSASAVNLIQLIAKLPKEKKMEILSLFPPGWRPGDPLPKNLPDPRELLAQISSSLTK